MKRFFNCFVLVVVVASLCSCTSARKLSYLTDMEYGVNYPAHPAPELVVQTGDCLGINISSETPELSKPFNIVSDISKAGDAVSHRYVVDGEGNIEFPVLGTLHVAGKTLAQVRELVASGIRDKGYIREPIVVATLENFSVTVIGQVGNSVLPVEGGSVNLLQVIARSGNITENSKIKDVMVVRTENGKREAYSVNLQSKSLFESPVFWLQQNDIVYVKPQGTRLSTTGQTAMTFVTAGLSLGVIVSNFFLWYLRR